MATVHRVAQEESEGSSDPRRGQPRMAMLGEYLARHGPVTIAEAFRAGADLAARLSEWHALGRLHLSIGPATVLLIEHAGRIVGADLKRLEAEEFDQPLADADNQLAYASPEHLQGSHVDARSDLYSLGCTLYAMTTGNGPFDGAAPEALVFEVCELSPQAVGELNPQLSAWQAAIIMRLIAKDPNQRFNMADEVAELLQMQQSATKVVYRPLPRPRTPARPIPAETPRSISIGNTNLVPPPPPRWTLPVMPAMPAPQSTSQPVRTMPWISPRLRKTARRYARKHKLRTVGIATLFLLLTIVGWQLGAMLSAKMAGRGIAHARNQHKSEHSSEESAIMKVRQIEESKAEASSNPVIAVSNPIPIVNKHLDGAVLHHPLQLSMHPRSKSHEISNSLEGQTQRLGMPARDFVIEPHAKMQWATYCLDRQAPDGPARGPLYLLSDPRHLLVSKDREGTVVITRAVSLQWLEIERTPANYIPALSAAREPLGSMGIIFVNRTDSRLTICMTGPLVIADDPHRGLKSIAMTTLNSLAIGPKNSFEQTKTETTTLNSFFGTANKYELFQEQIWRDDSALLIASNPSYLAKALPSFAEIIEGHHRQGERTFVLTKGKLPTEMLVIENDQIIGRLQGDEARQEFASISGNHDDKLLVERSSGIGKAPFPEIDNWDQIIRRKEAPDERKKPENMPDEKKAQEPVSTEERLRMPVTLSYPRITLEKVMHRVSTEIGVPITIVTKDLAKVGISKNQSLQLEVLNLTAGDCLQHILSLVDRSERLTFVIRERPDGREEIAITTHAGVAERNDRRAGEF